MFTDITASAGLGGEEFFQFWWGASAADYDNDGLLDLVVCGPGLFPGTFFSHVLPLKRSRFCVLDRTQVTPLNAEVNYDLYINGRNGEPVTHDAAVTARAVFEIPCIASVPAMAL